MVCDRVRAELLRRIGLNDVPDAEDFQWSIEKRRLVHFWLCF